MSQPPGSVGRIIEYRLNAAAYGARNGRQCAAPGADVDRGFGCGDLHDRRESPEPPHRPPHILTHLMLSLIHI